MDNASQIGDDQGYLGAGNFIVYADFNCPFSYALRHLAPDFQDEAIQVLDSQHQPQRHNMGTIEPARMGQGVSKSL